MEEQVMRQAAVVDGIVRFEGAREQEEEAERGRRGDDSASRVLCLCPGRGTLLIHGP
jgi:hypothetical protein